MNIEFVLARIEHRPEIENILLHSSWDFYTKTKMRVENCQQQFERNFYLREGVETFLLKDDLGAFVGLLRLFDLGKGKFDPETPLFDLKIRGASRNRGLGKLAVAWLIAHVFNNYPNKTRIEATTRIDNVAMRKVLLVNGFLKEAHYRKSWRTETGEMLDTIGYGLLREDWESGIPARLDWSS